VSILAFVESQVDPEVHPHITSLWLLHIPNLAISFHPALPLVSPLSFFVYEEKNTTNTRSPLRITATATIASNTSYLFPIIARQTIGRRTFTPSPSFSLHRFSLPCAIISSLYISFLVIVLLLPQVFPVTAATLNYSPIMIGGISIVSLVGWVLPWGLGGRHWFKGPMRTISEEVVRGGRVVSEEVGAKC